MTQFLKKDFEIELRSPKVSAESLAGALCSAFEGGSNYWYFIERKVAVVESEKRDLYGRVFHGQGVWISNRAGGDGPYEEAILDLKAIKKGLDLMLQNHPEEFSRIISDTSDAGDADIFLQYCVWGKVVYG